MGRRVGMARWVGNTALAALALGCGPAGAEVAEPASAATADRPPRQPARLVTQIDPDRAAHRSLRFVSLAPHLAREGDPYQYECFVDEPLGDEVTVTLVRAPEGAELDGDLLTWTPSHAQARHRQRFTLRAVDRYGEALEQSWYVVPHAHLHAILAGPRRHH
jgi:hypothetical protein